MSKLVILKKIIAKERICINKELLIISRSNTQEITREKSLINIRKSYIENHKNYLKIRNEDPTVKELIERIIIKVNDIANKLGIIVIKQDNNINSIILKNESQINFLKPNTDLLETINENSEEDDSSEENKNNNSETYALTINSTIMSLTEFMNLATKLLPEFDGSADNLQRFLDALGIIDTIKGNFEATAVEIVKTKLKGSVRNVITNETTIQAIKNKLKNTMKGKSVEVLSAKLTNIKQYNKTATIFTKEIEDISKLLENAYISDGLTSDLATKYATTAAVKALAQNTSNSKTKIVMESGNFDSMNEAIAKFINVSNDSKSDQASVLYYNRNNPRNYQNFNNRGRGRGYFNNSNQRPQQFNNNYRG